MNNVIVKLVLATIFLLLGSLLIFQEMANGETPGLRTFLGVNPGWVAIAFGFINLLRAYIAWNEAKRRSSAGTPPNPLHRPLDRHRRPREEQPPDPNFQFTDDPRP